MIALSYDDGPSRANTPVLLDILREKRARATFFVVGCEIDGNEELLSRILTEGHEIGNHSFSHADPLGLDNAALASEIESAHDAIVRTGGTPLLFRPPFGKRSRESVRVCAARGIRTILWSIDSGDTMGFAADRIVHEVVRCARPGDIVLMHDGGPPRPSTLEATRRIVDELTRRGYQFVTISELLAASGEAESSDAL